MSSTVPTTTTTAAEQMAKCAFGAAFACDPQQWAAAAANQPLVQATCEGDWDVPLGLPLAPVARWVRVKEACQK